MACANPAGQLDAADAGCQRYRLRSVPISHLEAGKFAAAGSTADAALVGVQRLAQDVLRHTDHVFARAHDQWIGMANRVRILSGVR